MFQFLSKVCNLYEEKIGAYKFKFVLIISSRSERFINNQTNKIQLVYMSS